MDDACAGGVVTGTWTAVGAGKAAGSNEAAGITNRSSRCSLAITLILSSTELYLKNTTDFGPDKCEHRIRQLNRLFVICSVGEQ